VGIEALADAVQVVEEPDTPGGEPCPTCGGVHDLPGLLSIDGLTDDDDFGDDDFGDDDFGDDDSWEHAEDILAGLADFGAAVIEDDSVRLTPLGSMLMSAVFEGCAPPPNADAETLVSTISELPPPVASTFAAPWLDARSANAAVMELLTFAEAAAGELRVAALAFSRELGPEAAAVWREWAERPGFGAYARQWLVDQGELAALDPADEAWLMVDALSVMLDALPDTLPPFLFASILQQELGGELAEALSMLRSSGHPAAADVVTRLTGQPSLASSLAVPGLGRLV
jgi:hypothetical protein